MCVSTQPVVRPVAVHEGTARHETAGEATRTCTDSSTLDLGAVRCTVTPVHGRWLGAASAASAAVF